MLNRWMRALAQPFAAMLVLMLGACAGGGDSGLTAPVINVQPADASVMSGQTASYSVIATASPMPTYQWRRNGVDIPGATSSSYVTPTLALSDGGAVYTVSVRNSQGTATSNEAKLGVGAVSSAEKRSLLEVLALTAKLYLAGLAPFELQDNQVFVEPTTVCQTGVGSAMLNGVPAVVGQSLPDAATISATFSDCTEVSGTSYSGTSSMVYEMPVCVCDVLNGTVPDQASGSMTATISNLRVTTRSNGLVDDDYTANGVGAITFSAAKGSAEDVVTVLLAPVSGATLRDELNGLTATFNGGTVGLTIGIGTSGDLRLQFATDRLSVSIAGVDYAANGTVELTSVAQDGSLTGSGEVRFTAGSTVLGRIYATAAGEIMIEVDGTAQAMRKPPGGLSRR
jgi:hypothetical protein